MSVSAIAYEFQHIRVEPLTDRIVTSRRRASLLREARLDPVTVDDRPIVIDLNPLNLLTLGAADELICTWLDRVRSRRNPVIVAIASFDDEIRGTVDAALKGAHYAAYLLRSSPYHEQASPFGEVTLIQAQTISVIRRLGRPVSAREASEALEVGHTNAAYMRLFQLYNRGLLGKVETSKSTEFFYPFPVDTVTLNIQ